MPVATRVRNPIIPAASLLEAELLRSGEIMLRSLSVALLVLLPSLAGSAPAQRKPQPEAPGTKTGPTVLTIAGKIGGKRFQASGNGTCRHAPDASIRGVSASLWIVQYSGSQEAALRQLNLTLWRPKDGSPDQLSLALETSTGSHRIDTGNPDEAKGEGTVTILPSGPGGRLEISGKVSGGKRIQMTIDCPAFAGVEAEGG
jgi:hypothetical protein